MTFPSSTSEVRVSSQTDETPPSPGTEISSELQALLQHVVDDVVDRLGCVGAMVATLEFDNSLPVRAYALNFSSSLLRKLEQRLGATLIGPKSVSYLDNKQYQDNLSAKAVKGVNGEPQIVVSNQLHDLFTPVVNKSLSDFAQRQTEIHQVIAVPLFWEDEVVGNLFAAAKFEFTPRDIDFLTAFGRQAAVAIKNQRNLAETEALERVIFGLQTSITDETQVLQTVVDAVVEKLGYVGALVATLESDNTLPIRAYTVDIAPGLLNQLRSRLGVDFIGPKSVAYLDDDAFKDNLSVRAVKGLNGRPERFLVSDQLYDLFRPVVNRTLSKIAQRLTGIKQVIAVPFFLNDEIVGNLFVATRRPKFTEREKMLLASFGQQAAVGIRNARLYQHAEEQREIAQVFAKMAFSAAANVHALRNHIGAFGSYLDLLKMLPMLPEKQQQEVLESTTSIKNNINEAAEVLDSLHEPWRKHPDVPTDVNQCLTRAIKKGFGSQSFDFNQPEQESEEGIILHFDFAAELPNLKTSPDMLTEAFRILIKNAAEAIVEHHQGSDLWISSRTIDGSLIEVIIKDNGIGIKPYHARKIFEMGWSSKEGRGMGFGLFWTKDYIEGMDGTITVESEWQKGTTFTLLLPASK